MALRLTEAIGRIPGVNLAYAMEGNGVFAEMEREVAESLQQDWQFHVWSASGNGRCVVRLMTAFNTTEADVDALAGALRDRLIHVKQPTA
jgi:threonine aldolase